MSLAVASACACPRLFLHRRRCGDDGVYPGAHHRIIELALIPVDPDGRQAPTWSTLVDLVLRALLREISAKRPRWGYRRAHVRLGELGRHVNRKRVQRLWREEGLRVPARRRKRQRLGESTVPPDRLRAEWPDHVWALDFQLDQTADGRVLKLLNVVDEFTREALSIHVARRIDSDQTVNVLERLANTRGAPTHVRCDNGPELTAHALRDWCRFRRAGTAFIEPGSPWQNAYVESFNGRLRDQLLDVEQFSCLAEAAVVIEDWRQDYNAHRPHSALDNRAPSVFASACALKRHLARQIFNLLRRPAVPTDVPTRVKTRTGKVRIPAPALI